jgi:hypothetical protein
MTRPLTLTALGVVLLLAAIPRLLTYDRYLPALDYSDETNMFLLSVDMRGIDEVPLADDYGASLTGEWLAGYPPLYPWLGVWTQRLQERTSEAFLFPGDHIGTMRLGSVVANLLTVGALFWLGWSLTRAQGELWALAGAVLVSLPYAISPQIIDVGNLAIPDSLVPLACALALLGGVRAVTQDRPTWLVVSLLGAVAAIYLKYSVLVGLWPTFCGVVVLVRRRGLRPMLPWLAVLAVISALTAGYLLWGYGALGLENREAENFRETGLANLLSVERNTVNFLTALRISTGIPLFTVGVLAGIGALFVGEKSGRGWNWLWTLIPFVVGNVLLTSSVVFADPQFGGYGRVRFVFPAAMGLSAIWAIAVVSAVQSLSVQRRWIGLLTVAVVCLTLVVPAVGPNLTLIRQYATTDTNQVLWEYADASLPADGTVMMPRFSKVHLTWNRPYSGYNGTKTFEWVYEDVPYQIDPQTAFDNGIHYFVYTEADQVVRLDTPPMYEWRDSLYHLKSIRPDGERVSGEWTHIYRMVPPEAEVDVAFGERIRLVGYDLSSIALSPGETLQIRPYWQASDTPTANYSLSVQLTPLDDPTTVIAQADGPPVSAARLPLTWDDPDEHLIGAAISLALSDDLPPGDYGLHLILYNFETGERLPVGNGDRYSISVTVILP